MANVTAAIVGPGNIGTDLLHKLHRSDLIDPRYMVGVEPDSQGLKIAADFGVRTSSDGVDWLFAQDPAPEIVFEATTAKAHMANAPRYEAAGIVAVDLTPAAVGTQIVPVVNGPELLGDVTNVNLITCGGQATVPMVAAVSRVSHVPYAEIIAVISSRSAGPGTRANIDEFTQTTARSLETIGGADRGKAVIVLNPAEPPLVMRDTVYCALPPDADLGAIHDSVTEMVGRVQAYVPGYRLVADPQFDEPWDGWGGLGRVTLLLEVEGRGDALPAFAGNLDIITAAAAQLGEELASLRLANA